MTARELVARWERSHRGRNGVDLRKLLEALVVRIERMEAAMAAAGVGFP